jgi:hypothetical protein
MKYNECEIRRAEDGYYEVWKHGIRVAKVSTVEKAKEQIDTYSGFIEQITNPDGYAEWLKEFRKYAGGRDNENNQSMGL